MTKRLSMLVVLFCSATLVANAPGQEDQFAEIVADGRKELRSMLKRSNTPGCQIAVSIDGQIIWTEGFGVRDVEAKTPVTFRTPFAIGSISKTLTAALLLRLDQDGKLDIDAHIEEYLDNFPHADRRITSRRILLHQSGLSDRFNSQNRYCRKHFENTTQALAEIFKESIEY